MESPWDQHENPALAVLRLQTLGAYAVEPTRRACCIRKPIGTEQVRLVAHFDWHALEARLLPPRPQHSALEVPLQLQQGAALQQRIGGGRPGSVYYVYLWDQDAPQVCMLRSPFLCLALGPCGHVFALYNPPNPFSLPSHRPHRAISTVQSAQAAAFNSLKDRPSPPTSRLHPCTTCACEA